MLVVDDLRHACGEPLPAGVTLIPFELTSPEARGEITRFRPHRVVHLAAQGGVARSVRDPAGDALANVVSTAALLRTCVDVGVQQVVFASSGGAIYGAATRQPTPERAPARPLSPYGAAKLACEGYLGMFSRTHGLRYCALRFGNVYGPHQDGTGEAGLVAISIVRLLARKPPVIFGDGGQSRDFVYVEDVAAAVLAALEGDHSGTFNIASGAAESVDRVVNELCRIAGQQSGPDYQPGRTGEVRSVQLDVSRALRTLAWGAQTDLKDGLASTWENFRDRARRPAVAAGQIRPGESHGITSA